MARHLLFLGLRKSARPRTTSGQEVRNILVADYTPFRDGGQNEIEDLLQIDRHARDQIETTESVRLAAEIVARLPHDEAEVETLIRKGYRLACNMSWDVVVRKYLLNDLTRVVKRQPQYSRS